MTDEVTIKAWQLVISIIGVLLIVGAGWQNLNLKVKEIEVKQDAHINQINLNTQKFDALNVQATDNQAVILNEIYEIKLLLKDKVDKPD